jgi:hypothetical protein
MMPPAASKSNMRVRPGGGFNQGLGNFDEEHLEDSAMQQAMQQKVLQQQNTNSGTKSPTQSQATGQPSAPPREVGTIASEATRAGQDVWLEVKEFFKVNTWLKINPETKDPQELAKQKQIHQRWQKLNQEQQAMAKRMYQQEVERKKVQAEEEERKNQVAQQQQQSELPMPSSPQKGPIGPTGSTKQKVIHKLQQDRQQLGGPSSAG